MGGHRNCFSAPSSFLQDAFVFESILQGNKWPMCCCACSIVISILPNTETFEKKSTATLFPLRRVNFRKHFVVPLRMKVAELCLATVPVYSISAGSAGVSPPTHPVAMRLLLGSISHNYTPKTG